MKQFIASIRLFFMLFFIKKSATIVEAEDPQYDSSIFKPGFKKLPNPYTLHLEEGRIWTDLEVIIAYCCTRINLSRIGYTKEFISDCLGRTKGSFDAIQTRLITYEFSKMHVGAPGGSASKLQREVVDKLGQETQDEIEMLFFEALLEFSIKNNLHIEGFLIESLKEII